MPLSNLRRIAVRAKLPAPYLIFLSGLFISNLGDSIYTFAMPWITYELTHSSIALSSMFAVQVLPVVLFGPVVGVIADTWDRRSLMMTADAARAVLVACVPVLEKAGVLQIWHLYLITFSLSVLSLLFEVANIASVPSIVGNELTRANASAQFINQLTAMAGPALAGIVVASLGGFNALWLDAVSFGATWIAVFQLPNLGGRQGSFDLRGFLADMKTGLNWLLRDKLNVALSLQAMVGNFGYSAAYSVLMFHLLSVLHLSARQVSINYTMIGIGGILGGLLIVPLEKRFRQGTLITVLLFIGAAGFITPTASRFWLGPGIAFAVVGVCNIGWNIMVQSIRQRTVPKELLGCVLGFSRSVTRLAMPVGAAVGGLITVHASPAAIFMVAGAAKLVEVIIAVFSPIGRL